MNSELQSLEEAQAARRARLPQLEDLIRDLDERLDTPQGLMREHLTALRGYLLDSMPLEYQATLEMAREILPGIDPPELRARIHQVLRQ